MLGGWETGNRGALSGSRFLANEDFIVYTVMEAEKKSTSHKVCVGVKRREVLHHYAEHPKDIRQKYKIMPAGAGQVT